MKQSLINSHGFLSRIRQSIGFFCLFTSISTLHGWAELSSNPTGSNPESSNQVQVNDGQEQTQPPSTPSSYSSQGSGGVYGGKIITGSVQTLQQAMQSEKESVDWYAWYLSARDYLDRTGRLHCPIGTPIKFYRNGVIQPLSDVPVCQDSLKGRFFPLPPNTHLEALVLPVRSGNGPPASEQEINHRVQQEE